MKLIAKITLSTFNSSGGGTINYATVHGSIVFEYDRWGEIVTIPTPEEWKMLYGNTWARDQRDAIIQDLTSQMVNSTRPNFEITKYGISFFNEKKREEIIRSAVSDSTATQAPALNEFIATFQKMPETDQAQIAVWIIDIETSSTEYADGLISEVLYGSKSITGNKLKLGFDKDVPILSGHKYIMREFEKVIKQYVNANHVWRCRLHVETSQIEVDLARNYFSQFR